MKKLLLMGMMCLMSVVTFGNTTKPNAKLETIKALNLSRASCTQTVTVTVSLGNGGTVSSTVTYTANSPNGSMLCSLATSMARMEAENHLRGLLQRPAGPEVFYINDPEN